jgi:starvation-inducible outer membrane lipoprotein
MALSACAAHPVFPPKVMEGIESNFDFARWHMMPNEAEGKKVQLGGRIVQSQTSGDMVTIVVAQLPIVDHPAYGPKDNEKNNGEFVITYQGTIQASFLQQGNRIMVVGVTRPSKAVTVDDLTRNFPIVAAQCLHVWGTQGRDIDDFPYYEAGYVNLEQKTVCARPPTP